MEPEDPPVPPLQLAPLQVPALPAEPAQTPPPHGSIVPALPVTPPLAPDEYPVAPVWPVAPSWPPAPVWPVAPLWPELSDDPVTPLPELPRLAARASAGAVARATCGCDRARTTEREETASEKSRERDAGEREVRRHAGGSTERGHALLQHPACRTRRSPVELFLAVFRGRRRAKGVTPPDRAAALANRGAQNFLKRRSRGVRGSAVGAKVRRKRRVEAMHRKC